MRTTDEIINDYRRGMSYRKLTLDELVEVSTDRINELAAEYGIKKSSYGVSDEDILSYCLALSNCRMDYWSFKKEKIDDNYGRWFLFVLTVTIIISLFVFTISIYFAGIFVIIIGWLVHKFLYPSFEEWYRNRLIEEFLIKHNINRDFKVENYINEVMFQTYARNKSQMIAGA